MNIDTIKSCLLAGVMLWAGSLGMKAQHEEGDETFQFRAGATFSTLSGDDDAKMKVTSVMVWSTSISSTTSLALPLGCSLPTRDASTRRMVSRPP